MDGGTASTGDAWMEKVDPWVFSSVERQGEAEVLVMLDEQADLRGAGDRATKPDKSRFVYERLTEVAIRTQGPVLELLRSLDVPYRSYWVANMIWVRAEISVIEQVARLPQVSHLYANPRVQFPEPSSGGNAGVPERRAGLEWNIAQIRALEVWAEGFTGQGVVIAGQDTGYDWDHPALINQYRGWGGAGVDHNYSWHDAIHEDNPNTSPGNLCGFDTTEPCDDHGHGTHTMGIMVGEDSGVNRIGVAPGAKWIGCRNMEQGWGSPATYAECFQWFIAPTDLNDQNPDPSMAPHVINNSWACPPSEGCTDPNALKIVVENTRAAGIVVVTSAGNSGSECATVENPVAIYDAVLSVGATDSENGIASFSSRGPVMVDGSGRLKPDVSAPGVGVRSSYPGATYISQSGTSMASPHVAGMVALLLSANPLLAGRVEAIETAVKKSAFPLTTSQSCGGVPGSEVPNNTYGYGRIDSIDAVDSIGSLQLKNAVSAQFVEPGDFVTYTLTLTNTSVITTTSTERLILVDDVPSSTDFITATLPHEIDGSKVIWDVTDTFTDSVQSVELIVQVDEGASGVISNDRVGIGRAGFVIYTGNPVQFMVLNRGVSLAPDLFETVLPDSTVFYTHTLHNTGIITDSFNITHQSSQDWTATYTSTFTLGPDQTAPVSVELTVPADVVSGTVDTLVLTATSQSTPAVSDTVMDTTTISAEKTIYFLYFPLMDRPEP